MALILSLPVSLLLGWLLLRIKRDDPFPKGGVRRLLLAGAVSAVAACILYAVLAAALVLIRIGPNTAGELIRLLRDDPAAAAERMNSLSAALHAPSPLWTLFTTFVTAGLQEELCKYLACRIVIDEKKEMVRTWMDAVICFALVALSFELFENLLYGGENGVITAIIRNLTPLHFCCGVIMGWYFGKSLVSGEKKYRRAAILAPTLIHTLYDTALNLMPMGESDAAELSTSEVLFILFGLLAFLAAMILSIVVVVKLVRWKKKGTLNVPVQKAERAERSAGIPSDSSAV